jgi:hypothetical protein
LEAKKIVGGLEIGNIGKAVVKARRQLYVHSALTGLHFRNGKVNK